jgi:hypothetical protein
MSIFLIVHVIMFETFFYTIRSILIINNMKNLYASVFCLYLILFAPNNVKEHEPVFLLIDPWFAESNNPHWKQKSEYFPVEEALRRGYGMAVFDAAQLDPDNLDNFKNGIHSVLDQNPRPADAYNLLLKDWSWFMDFAEKT